MNELSARPALRRQIVDEAAAWFVEFRVGDATPDTCEAFSIWLRRSPEHIQAYLEIAATYANLPVPEDPRALDVERLIAAARVSADVIPFDPGGRLAPAPNVERRRMVSWRAVVAASIAFLAAGVGLFTWYEVRSGPVYVTEVGEQRSIELADGSNVELNSRSRLRVRYSERRRDVELLTGQALFRVARDTARPFVVRVAGAEVRAVGTQFDINRRASGTTVTVIEGSVAVSTPASRKAAAATEVVLTAGEQAIVKEQAVARSKSVDIAAVTAWTERRLVFDSTRLADVVEEFNRHNTRPLILEGEELAALRISGVYTSTDPTSLLRFLRAQPGIVVTETESQVRISQLEPR